MLCMQREPLLPPYASTNGFFRVQRLPTGLGYPGCDPWVLVDLLTSQLPRAVFSPSPVYRAVSLLHSKWIQTDWL